MNMIVKPKYINSFHCLGSKCSSTCCKGFDIEVDSDSLVRYKNGTLAERELLDNIVDDETGSYIKMNAMGVCPLLQSDGLCSLVVQGGESSLCEVCHEFPRFYNVLGDYMEMGLNLSCEESVRLLLSCPKIEFDISGECELFDDEKEDIRQKYKYIDIVISNAHTLSENIKLLLNCFENMEKFDFDKITKIFTKLDYIDTSYGKAILKVSLCDKKSVFNDNELENILVYFLYRYLINYDFDYIDQVIVTFAVFMTKVINSIVVKDTDKVEDIVRFSREIEASVDNVYAIMSYIYECL